MGPDDFADSHAAAHEMCSEANRLQEEGAGREAMAIYDDVVARFDSSEDDSSEDDYLQDVVASALARRAEIRALEPELASGEEPTADLLPRFKRAHKPEQREHLARAIISETAVSARSEQYEQALALSKKLIAAVDDRDCRGVRRIAALALQNQVEFLTAQGHALEAAETLAQLTTRFGGDLLAYYDEEIAENDSADPETRLGLRYRRAELLRALGDTDEALDAYTEIISEFGEDHDAGVRVVIDRARDRQAELTSGQK